MEFDPGMVEGYMAADSLFCDVLRSGSLEARDRRYVGLVWGYRHLQFRSHLFFL